jgi:2-phospho-L-lactate guanylyltransferase (CobY/MobA/RfbA family)
MPSEQRALLIFGGSGLADCKRRGWPSAFRVLFEAQSFAFAQKPGFDIHLFTSDGSTGHDESSFHIHPQEGSSFGQRLENAIESLAQDGYKEIVIVGRDCPDLEPDDVLRAFALLKQHRLVLGPDHRGGCYLIGIHSSDREKLHAIRWQQNTDFEEIHHRFAAFASIDLPVKMDLDTLEDVRLLAASESRFHALAKALLNANSQTPQTESDPHSTCTHEERIHWQLPPPASFYSFAIV